MRRLALIGLVACGAPAPPPPTMLQPHATPVPKQEPVVEVVQRAEDGTETIVRWDGGEPPAPREEVGWFAYAQVKAELIEDGVAIGWLEPGARVGIAQISGGRALVALFAWTSRDASTPVKACVDARVLGPRPVKGAFSEPARRVMVEAGQELLRSDRAKLGYTFCGVIEVVEEGEHGMRVRQREDGVVIEGVLAERARLTDQCPGSVIVEWEQGRERRRNGRMRPEREAGLPDGLVAAGKVEGPTFAELVAKRAAIYWLVEKGTCEAWTLVPPKRADEPAVLEQRRRSGAETAITTYQVHFTAEPTTTVGLAGPSTRVIAAPGKQPMTGGFGMPCATQYQVIESVPGMLVMHRSPPGLGRITAYDSADSERWYTDRARCERDAEAKRNKVALGVAMHRGC